jgi:uncharacterized spore protein YtfJ
MEIQELISSARDAVSVKRVYGDPYEKEGVTVIPAAAVRGGGGAGGDHGGDDAGKGGGFGVMARPSGAWILEGDTVTWKPAIDVNRIILGGQLVALTAILVAGRIVLTRGERRSPLDTLLAAAPLLLRRMPFRMR